MASNATPNFVKNGIISAVRVTAANTSSEGGGTIGTDIFLVQVADATNGSFIESVRWIGRASAANTALSATVGRLFVSSKSSGATTSADTDLLMEITLPTATGDSSTAATPWYDLAVNVRLEAGQTLLATTHAAPAASSSYASMSLGGGDY